MLEQATIDAVHASFNLQGTMKAFGARLTLVEAGLCEIRAPISPAASQQHGYFHGGVVGAIADTAGGYAANSLLMPSRECLTAEYKINMLAPAHGDILIARGTVVRSGRTLIVATVEVKTSRAGMETTCAIMQMTLFAIDRRN